MQLTRQTVHVQHGMSNSFFAHIRLQVIVWSCIWVAGLLIAGSDSPYMPWLNGIGALFLSGASLALGKLLSRLEPDASASFSHEWRPDYMDDIKKHRLKRTHDTLLTCAVMSRDRIFSNF